MNAAVASNDILRPRVQEGWRQGLVMALAAHGLLAVGLMLHMSWKTQPRDVVEAEVWAEVPVAAQPAARIEPAPAPVVPPPPAPEPAPAPPPAPAPTPAPPPKPADIQVERKPEPEKKKPAKEVFEPDPPPLKKKLEEARKKPEPVKEPLKEAAKELPKPVAKEVPKEVPKEKVKSEPGPSAAQLERERQARLKSLMADLGGEGTPSAGPSAAYAGRIKARIKPNIVFTDEVAGNPLATVEVRCAPDGRIIGRRLITRSGHTAWDDAVLRAVDRTEVLPLDERGKVPPVMQIDFRPRDF